MTETPFGLALLQADMLTRWLPGLLFGIILFLVLRRYSHFLLLPALLLSAIGLFYLVILISTGSITTAGTDGWLLGPFPEGGVWQPVALTAIPQVDWRLVLGNATGIEIATGGDVDVNQELKAAGVALLFPA